MLRWVLLFAALPLLAADTHLFPPIHIIGSVYYVGDDDLASFLITTPKGHILINSGFDPGVPDIRARVQALKFRFSDIKILLVTHAHGDHAAGLASIKRLTGAKMMAIEQETELLESGGKTDFLFGSSNWFKPVKVDRRFKDGETIELGGTVLTAHWTPGHTKGATTFTMEIAEGGKLYHVVFANLGNVNEGTELMKNPLYPNIKEDFRRTFAVQMQLPCDVFLTSHASQFRLFVKWHPGLAYDPDAFVDPAGYYRAVQRTIDAFERNVAEQKEEDQANQDRLHFKDVIPQQP